MHREIRVTYLTESCSSKPTKLAPAVGFEPTTNRLTADRSTTELRWIGFLLRLRGAYILLTQYEAASLTLIVILRRIKTAA
jgi:hypothetical protein